MANWYYKKHNVSKNVFVIKMENSITKEITSLSSYEFSSYNTAIETLKSNLILERVKFSEKQYNENTDMTEILKGFIEVHEKLDGVLNKDVIKVYNYIF